MTKGPLKSRHHHGDLKPALIKAGIDLLEEGGINALSLRKCAARAGVSHAAPAHHFDGLAGLKQAIAEEGFHLFSSYLQGACDSGPQDPKGRLRSLCRGYLQFGLDHPGILAVIFGDQGLAGLVHGGGKEKADAYLTLRAVAAPFVAPGQDRLVVETQIWSLIHGFTLLYLAGEFGSPPPPIDEGPFAQVIALLDALHPASAP
ncbi:TetR/AcrR family transcriptional regulator [Phaeobacter sp. QD34_3]|uniref:TetR/AcrR family transcriptional regulator n=1 Tax=unclassified Phaeobacter TaxID=2621772 RepID=UPI00237F7F53|nr:MULTISPECIES: TetR/AcrR family transcriptional regulator [unclassified Phaeobacter]MDE4133774.1 TetR/AcrR family transcriptional regulator [Phaeobacter sp. QD34_3]MDE4137293.1 TetR/AcrR family transcriptional regulator [Phaeobacter sp. QD34_24]